jgi:hypothetical protein
MGQSLQNCSTAVLEAIQIRRNYGDSDLLWCVNGEIVEAEIILPLPGAAG